MMRENNEKVLRVIKAIIQQFSQFAKANREKGTFLVNLRLILRVGPPLTQFLIT